MAFRQRLSTKTVVTLVILLVLLIGGAVGYAKYTDQKEKARLLQEENARLSNPQEAAKAEAARIKAEVGQAYQLPDEEPTIATVVDANKLKEQAFFANAQNEDKVLIFTQAKLAILYRPSTKKIIQVAPINLGENSNTTQN